ncbi:hypothetical protein G6L99_30475 [Agrobacterium rhizogenes]|uniref:hypothetical protein n=1 Tax=Rhizobium rhizogenes TaxID=359 RepID=UPI0015742505|nr:hypothetical protein [Rhizobium rhizogenes]NTH16452.1 hypothetical protein [Rhizobium rhizogenes]NTI78425.1 hypothetical protein [Rhizobium rhizogenes]
MQQIILADHGNLCAAAASALPCSKMIESFSEIERLPKEILTTVSRILAWANEVADAIEGPKQVAITRWEPEAIVAAIPSSPDIEKVREDISKLICSAATCYGEIGRFDQRLFALAAIQGVLEAGITATR